MAGRGGLAVHDLSGIKTIRPSALLEGVRDSYIWPGLARLQDAVAFNPYSSTAAQDATRQITGPPAQYREPINRVLHGVGQDAPLIAATAPLGGMASAARAGLGGLAGSAVGHTLKERGHGGLSQFLGDTGTDMLVSMAMPAVIPAAIGREVIEGVAEKTTKETVEDLAYRGLHTAPGADATPAFDLTLGIPDDVYGPNGARFYGDGYGAMDEEAVSILRKIRNKPDADVVVYRAVPKDSPADRINPGDWVTTVKKYAARHGRRFDGHKILKMKVKARELHTDHNSLFEYGYNPEIPE